MNTELPERNLHRPIYRLTDLIKTVGQQMVAALHAIEHEKEKYRRRKIAKDFK